MDPPILYAWERLPEYRATQQFSRCLGRIFASLPPRLRPRVERPLIRATVMIGQGIVGMNAEVPAGQLSPQQRDALRDAGLASIALCTEGLELLKQAGLGSRPDLLAALELLERIEFGMSGRASQ